MTTRTINFVGNGTKATFDIPSAYASIATITLAGVPTVAYTDNSGSVTFDAAPGNAVAIVITLNLALSGDQEIADAEGTSAAELTAALADIPTNAVVGEALMSMMLTINANTTAAVAGIVPQVSNNQVIEYYGDTVPAGYTAMPTPHPAFATIRSPLSNINGASVGTVVNVNHNELIHAGGYGFSTTLQYFPDYSIGAGAGATPVYITAVCHINKSRGVATTVSPVALGNAGAGCADSAGNVFIFGGYPGSALNTIYKRNYSDASWTAKVAPWAAGRYGAAAVRLNDNAILNGGGILIDTTLQSTYYIYNQTANTNTPTGSIITPARACACVAISATKALLIGGVTISGWTTKVATYDLGSGTFSESPGDVLPFLMVEHSAVMSPDGYVYVMGRITEFSDIPNPKGDYIILKGNPALFGTGNSPWSIVSFFEHGLGGAKLGYIGNEGKRLVVIGGVRPFYSDGSIVAASTKCMELDLTAPRYAYKTPV